MSFQEPLVNPENESKLTFWSIPPFRQQFQTVARTIKVREVRFIVAEVYGLFYMLYGIKVPVILLMLWSKSFGLPPLDVVRSYMIPAMILSGVFCALTAGGITWFVLGRAIQCRRHSRVRFGIWGALALGVPMLTMFAVAPAEKLLFLSGVFVLMLLFGAGVAAGSCWVIQRDKSRQASDCCGDPF